MHPRKQWPMWQCSCTLARYSHQTCHQCLWQWIRNHIVAARPGHSPAYRLLQFNSLRSLNISTALKTQRFIQGLRGWFHVCMSVLHSWGQKEPVGTQRGQKGWWWKPGWGLPWRRLPCLWCWRRSHVCVAWCSNLWWWCHSAAWTPHRVACWHPPPLLGGVGLTSSCWIGKLCSFLPSSWTLPWQQQVCLEEDDVCRPTMEVPWWECGEPIHTWWLGSSVSGTE